MLKPKKKGNVFCVYLWTPGTSSTKHDLRDIGMSVMPGEAFECAPNVAQALAKAFKGRVVQVQAIEVDEPEEKPKKKKGGKK